ncbi:oleate hydratase [Fournierella sp.]|uniref:oleate hydratase n=1 Tax=Allofournierella sp. TaxID=1940256 RepID=UPI0025BDA222|nr:oleate hydratase [Fournierella sp.]
MYYSNGNYEAFARPRTPKKAEGKSAWLVGGGLASLSAAAFLIRDGGIPGERIHILEEAPLPGGACDGILDPQLGFVIRGGREMEDHYECLWDLYRSIPSLEVENASVLDEFYWLNKDDPNFSLNRATLNQGVSAETGNRFGLSDAAALELMALFFAKDEDLYNKTIDEVFSDEFYASNFWLYWQTMFAFEKWHSALEMKLYLHRLDESDLVFVTNGSCTEGAALGSNDEAPRLTVENGEGSSWQLWKNLAVQNPAFGNPDAFCSDIQATKWESATVTLLDDRIASYVQKICRRDPYSGRVVTGGIVTAKDSAWLMSWTFNRQPHFKAQPAGQLVGWIYGLSPDEPGDYVGKPMAECTGAEICMEWLYHLGVPENEIELLAREAASTVPCMMPYVTAFFMPRAAGDRPQVVPAECVNFAFLGQFAETRHDTIFTTEYSVRTAMEAVYTLLDVERGVPEVFGSAYDLRCLLNATHYLLDGRKLTDMKLPLPYKLALHAGLDKFQGTVLEELLARYQLI